MKGLPVDSPSRPHARLRPEIDDLEESKIVEVWQLGLGRTDLIRLWVGESDVVTPPFIRQAAAAALEAGHTFYSYKRGEPELRETLAAYINRLHGTPARPLPVNSDRITVTSAGMNASRPLCSKPTHPPCTVISPTPCSSIVSV